MFDPHGYYDRPRRINRKGQIIQKKARDPPFIATDALIKRFRQYFKNAGEIRPDNRLDEVGFIDDTFLPVYYGFDEFQFIKSGKFTSATGDDFPLLAGLNIYLFRFYDPSIFAIFIRYTSTGVISNIPFNENLFNLDYDAYRCLINTSNDDTILNIGFGRSGSLYVVSGVNSNQTISQMFCQVSGEFVNYSKLPPPVVPPSGT